MLQKILEVQMLSSDFLRLQKSSVLCWLATADDKGMPNVSPKEVWAVFDDRHIVIANIASPVSVRNVQVNPLVCLSFVDILVQKGFKVSGRATNIARADSQYLEWAKQLEEKVGSKFPIQSVIVLEVTKVCPIVAPSYLLYPHETTESNQRESAMQTYGWQS